jgi:chondroitin AC lyase
MWLGAAVSITHATESAPALRVAHGADGIVIEADLLSTNNEYALQRTTDLAAPVWTNVNSAVWGTNEAAWALNEETSDTASAFFRMSEQDAGVAHMPQFQEQFVDYYLLNPPDADEVLELLNSQMTNGSWTNVDYTSTATGSWPTRTHLDYVLTLAEAYANDPTNEDLKEAVLLGLDFWLVNDFDNANWFNPAIGVPLRMGKAIVLMGDAVPEDLITQALATVFSDDRTEFGTRTGQNKVWQAAIELMKGWMRGDGDLMKQASTVIQSEVLVSTDEGIQPDWSYHQHGAQLQMGNYGLSYAEEQVFWAWATHDTIFGYATDSIGILRNYLLHGQAWVIWKDWFDLSACGRQFDDGNQYEKGQTIRQLIGFMEGADSAYASDYAERLSLPGGITGSKVFWRSDYAMHRRPDWYASVRMCSERMYGGEIENGENLTGLHAADGVMLLHQTGEEYLNIGGVWNWRRLPGTTVDQGISDLKGTDAKMLGRTSFVGGFGDDDYGVSAMHYVRYGLTAYKAWFMEEDAVVCLGAGIDGSTSGNVYTSAEQSWLTGSVTSSVGAVSSGISTLPAGAWVNHGNIGYQFDQSATLSVDTQTGNWIDIYSSRGDRPVTGEVFSVWYDHGASPDSQSYSYTIYPQTAPEEMADKINAHSTVIRSNTAQLQAVEGDGGVYAVFYQAGTLTLGSGDEITVDQPCILSVRNNTLTVCDPNHAISSVNVTIAGQLKNVALPTEDGYAGQPVVIDF